MEFSTQESDVHFRVIHRSTFDYDDYGEQVVDLH